LRSGARAAPFLSVEAGKICRARQNLPGRFCPPAGDEASLLWFARNY
jgi:hypothetical protein